MIFRISYNGNGFSHFVEKNAFQRQRIPLIRSVAIVVISAVANIQTAKQ